jgi:hypothetical protein
MTPKEKAIELVNKFKSNVYKKAFADTDFMYDRYYGLDDEMAKQCALIAVDEILEEYKEDYKDIHKDIFTIYSWWKQVKTEIENL